MSTREKIEAFLNGLSFETLSVLRRVIIKEMYDVDYQGYVVDDINMHLYQGIVLDVYFKRAQAVIDGR